MTKKWFKAFATGLANNSPRVPIDAERIVVALGNDSSGRPLEISISLEQSDKHPDELGVYAIEERWFATPIKHLPQLIVHKSPWTQNTGYLTVRFWSVPKTQGDPPGDES